VKVLGETGDCGSWPAMTVRGRLGLRVVVCDDRMWD